MDAKNNFEFIGEESMGQKCTKCFAPAHCYGSPNVSGGKGESEIIHRYYACSDVGPGRCNTQFTIVSHFGKYIEGNPQMSFDMDDLLERIPSMDSSQQQQLLEALQKKAS